MPQLRLRRNAHRIADHIGRLRPAGRRIDDLLHVGRDAEEGVRLQRALDVVAVVERNYRHPRGRCTLEQMDGTSAVGDYRIHGTLPQQTRGLEARDQVVMTGIAQGHDLDAVRAEVGHLLLIAPIDQQDHLMTDARQQSSGFDGGRPAPARGVAIHGVHDPHAAAPPRAPWCRATSSETCRSSKPAITSSE